MLEAKETVTVEEGGTVTVKLELKSNPNAGAAEVPVESKEQPEKTPKGKVEVAPQETGNAQKTWGWISIGTGVVVGGVGGVFWFTANRSQQDISNDDDLCRNNNCTAEGITQLNQAKTQALIGDIAIATGAVAVGVGAILLATAKKKPANETGIRSIVPTADQNGGYLVVQGGF